MTALRSEGLLPGGLVEGGARTRTYAFRPLDGAVELALGEVVVDAPSLPVAVTRALCATLATLGDAPASAERVDALCVADRQFLMRELQCLCDASTRWLVATCAVCGERFDLEVDLRALPVTPAPAPFPLASGTHDGRVWHARLPTGADQAWLARADAASLGNDDVGGDDKDIADLETRLMQRLLLDGTDPHLSENPATPGLREAVEAALDAVAPGVVTTLGAPCPVCGQVNAVTTDPYERLGTGLDDLLRQVYALASHYHWSEADILRLPRSRRHAYLALLDTAVETA
ncbi:MAG TPA: hypothetical protein VFY73_27895 [Ideonella sp.]|uniref:hypothetical protein n=1 Tax=Ideonella sp. TaxID=1929293 RepID=UPI002E30D1D8|nr:hypothetical protein [Ideonella sp.]HEX5687856.1 hypothetical protein [Ideonella sp.]